MSESLEPIALRLAAFINEALELDEDPSDLAEEILPFKRDQNAGISTIELDSSIGVAAFLIIEAIPALTAPAEDIPGGEGLGDYVAPLILGTLLGAVLALMVATLVNVRSRR